VWFLDRLVRHHGDDRGATVGEILHHAWEIGRDRPGEGADQLFHHAVGERQFMAKADRGHEVVEGDD
jgi:hypothetical protein